MIVCVAQWLASMVHKSPGYSPCLKELDFLSLIYVHVHASEGHPWQQCNNQWIEDTGFRMQLVNFISCYGFPLTPIFLILLFLLSQSVREILSFDKQQEQQIHREVQPENSIGLTHFFLPLWPWNAVLL